MDANAREWNQSPSIVAGRISSNSELPVAYSLFGFYSRLFAFIRGYSPVRCCSGTVRERRVACNRNVTAPLPEAAMSASSFEVGLMVIVPSRQSRVACVFKQEFQRRRLYMAIAEYHIRSTPMAGRNVAIVRERFDRPAHEQCGAIKTISDDHHIARNNDFRFIDRGE